MEGFYFMATKKIGFIKVPREIHNLYYSGVFFDFSVFGNVFVLDIKLDDNYDIYIYKVISPYLHPIQEGQLIPTYSIQQVRDLIHGSDSKRDSAKPF